MITITVTNGELLTLRHALQIYARRYQDMKAKEKDLGNKENLQTYVDAADRLNTKLYGLMKQEAHHTTPTEAA